MVLKMELMESREGREVPGEKGTGQLKSTKKGVSPAPEVWDQVDFWAKGQFFLCSHPLEKGQGSNEL